MKKLAYFFLAVVFLSVIGLPSAHADLYVSSTDGTNGNIYRYNETDGFDSDPVIADINDPRRLVIHPENGDIYVVTYGDNKVLRYSYNGATYALAGAIDTFISSESLALGPDPDDPDFLYVLNELEDGMGAVFECALDYVGHISGCAEFASGTELDGFPADMVFGPNFDEDGIQDIYITNPGQNKIVRIHSVKNGNDPREIVILINGAGTNVSAMDFGDINDDGKPDLYLYLNPSIGNEENSERIDVYDGITWDKVTTLIDPIRIGDFVIHTDGNIYATLINDGNVSSYNGISGDGPDLLDTIPDPGTYVAKGLAFDECGLGTHYTYYEDADGDGFGNPMVSQEACTPPAGYVADNSDCDDTDDSVYPDAPELCDNKDNDCDESTDEDLTRDTTCGVGECAGNTGFETCTAGVWGDNTCDPFDGAAAESCDNNDNDCDGTVDEDLTRGTTCGVGACASVGEETCSAGEWGGDTCTEGSPSEELCDNIDNDCDGVVDESLTRDTTCGEGACAATGEETCSAGVWGGDTCTEGTPSDELCDNIDNDCDGAVDEGLTRPTTCGEGACADNTGQETCTAGSWGDDTCDPFDGATAESCDNIDNDCDGAVDESLTRDTTCGEGACAATGEETCTGGSWGDDTCVAGTSSEEVCDNIDNDCDGAVDEGLTRASTCGEGACSDNTGQETCTAGEWGDDTCDPFDGATAESCDNIDNDCDGAVDESLTRATTCGGEGACAATGEETCTAGSWGDDTCVPGTSSEEVCDNIDNDCDGAVDEDLTRASTCGVGACAAVGEETCTAGSWGDDTCVAGTSSEEVCDNIDNDCDGSTDEDLTRPTTCGVGECSGNTGQETCTAGSWGDDTCDPLDGASAESCDNKDNDCDGNVDEEVALTFYRDSDQDEYGDATESTEACSAPEGYVDNDTDCDDGDADVNPGAEEVCNDIDDNCDGNTDEGYDLDSDGIADCIDNCPTVANADQVDADLDGAGAACDSDDDDPTVCGDVDEDTCDDCSSGSNDPANDGPDADADGWCDAGDQCPNDADNDVDEDGVCGDVDNCPTVANADQVDADSDGVGAACDPDDDDPTVCGDVDEDTCDDCSSGSNDPANDGPDADADGWCDAGDQCPNDADNDVDEDGVCGDVDNCPTVANADQVDADSDGAGAACDPDDGDPTVCGDKDDDTCDDCSSGSNDPANDGLDTDADGICDNGDNCLNDANAGQSDTDGDGLGDVCDSCPNDAANDIDGDGFCAGEDNCPSTFNPMQFDADDDGIGDACDPSDPPAIPTPTIPEDGDNFDEGDPITLGGGPYSDPNGNVHYYTYWQIRRADKPYDPDDDDLYEAKVMIDGEPLTQYEIPPEVLEQLESGLEYAWRVGYMDEYNYNIENPSWSAWSSFKIGTSVADRIPAIPPGTDLADYRMVSFTQWPDDPAATSVFGITCDPDLYKMGTYDPMIEDYIRCEDGIEVEPGRAYWILAREGLNVSSNGIPVSKLSDIYVGLEYNPDGNPEPDGWNMIAPPNEANYYWGDIKIQVYDAEGNPLFVEPVAIFDLNQGNSYIDIRIWDWQSGSYESYQPSDDFLMEKYKGYWVYAKQANVYLVFPANAQASLTKPTTMLASYMGKGKRWLNKWVLPAVAIAEVDAGPPMPTMGALGTTNQSDSVGSESSGGGGGCFIATAAYGSLMSPHVKILREFRDRFLINNFMGKAFVALYYKTSPPLADFIAEHGSLRTVVRISLLPVVGASWAVLQIGFIPAMALMFSFLCIFVGVVCFRRKRITA